MKGTVLIVDDDAEVVRTFSDWLRLDGYAVCTARNGEAALAALADVDAIILDVRMPILDGVGFLRRARSRGVSAPVAIVTGDYLIDEAVVSELEALNATVLFKPLWVDDLVGIAVEMLEGTS